jgi:hypothetical protein
MQMSRNSQRKQLQTPNLPDFSKTRPLPFFNSRQTGRNERAQLSIDTGGSHVRTAAGNKRKTADGRAQNQSVMSSYRQTVRTGGQDIEESLFNMSLTHRQFFQIE